MNAKEQEKCLLIGVLIQNLDFPVSSCNKAYQRQVGPDKCS